MCGINGVHAYHYAANPVDRAEVLRTRDHMMKRGPDGAGAWFSEDGRVGLGHRRLSIVDLSDAGAQPMASADGRLVVTFNGEIYNYPELRTSLEAQGCVFRSQSDTEVLLHLYRRKGVDMARDLRGMFAFALWDDEERRLFLARDPYGIKPLYYADDGWTFRFASQVKALLAGGALSREPDPAGHVGFFLLGSAPEPFTVWRDIRAVPAGSMLIVDEAGAAAPLRYHAIAAAYGGRAGPAREDRDVAQETRAALADSVRAHLMADVPVGAFLSAGVDSGALVGLMRDAGAADIQTITIGFDEFVGTANDETTLAREVAERYGTRHTTRIVTQKEFEADLPLIVEAMDQPTIDGVNTWFVSKAARELGLKVAISGLGGDELLGGYPSFRDVPRWVRLFAGPARIPLLGRAARIALSDLAIRLDVNPKAAGLLELGGTWAGCWLLKRGLFLPWELQQALDPQTVRDGLRRLAPLKLIGDVLRPPPRSAFARVATLESALYMRNQLLRDTDWASMAHSLEVRTPLVDSALLSRLAPYQGRFGAQRGKHVLADAPTRPLPASVANRAKTGFTTPVDRWMRAAVAQRHAGVGASAAPWARDWSKIVAPAVTAT